MDKDNACGVGNYSTFKCEISAIFHWFLCISLNVLVSFFRAYRNYFKKVKTHQHI
jgi:hypothetical protein